MAAPAKLFLLLHRARQSLFSRLNEETLRRFDVSVAQLVALFYLDKAGASRMGALADALHIDAGAASRLVERLEKKGLVERVSHPSDGRVRLLRASGHGERKAAAGQKALAVANQRLTAGFTEEEIAVVARFLNHVISESEKKEDE